jgi:hypothetical protein
MPRGGKRPGAGARPGNINALKTGVYSRRAKAIHKALAQSPAVMEFVSQLTSGDPREIETTGYLLRYLGDTLLRSAGARDLRSFRSPDDREVLAQVMRRWQPRTSQERLP